MERLSLVWYFDVMKKKLAFLHAFSKWTIILGHPKRNEQPRIWDGGSTTVNDCPCTPYHSSLATSARTGFSPAGVLTLAWLTSGYWVDEWFPQMITFLTSDTGTFNLSETWPRALLWSNLVKQEMFFSGIEGANSFRISALVLAGLATTKTWKKQQTN